MSKHCADCARRFAPCPNCTQRCMIECSGARYDLADKCDKFTPKKEEAEKK